MSGSKRIAVMESVYKRNEDAAGEFNKLLTAKKIFCVNVIGSPGAGKTTLLIKIIQNLGRSACVIEGDIESSIDTARLIEHGIVATQLNTGGACHLDAPSVRRAFEGAWPSYVDGFLFVENVGNLVCPAEFLIGEHARMLVCSVTDGSDKPYKYPLAFERADAVLVNKIDLLKYVEFDENFFTDGVRRLNGRAPIFFVSGTAGDGTAGDGADAVAEWMRETAVKYIV